MRLARRLLGLSLAALMGACADDAAAPSPIAYVEADRVAEHLARVCPCTGEGEAIPFVALFGDDFMTHDELVMLGGRFVIDLGSEIPQDELPLTLLYRAIDDGLASGQKLSLIRAKRQPDLGRTFLDFSVEGIIDSGMRYVVDEASNRICCKSEMSTKRVSSR